MRTFALTDPALESEVMIKGSFGPSVALIALVTALSSLTPATLEASGAMTQLAGVAGCVSETGTGATCADGRGLDGAAWVTASADGKFVYAASFDGSTVATFSRNASTGALTQLAGTAGCVAEDGDGSTCADGRGLSGVAALALSPDGSYLYAASRAGALAIFSRNTTTGILTQLAGTNGCIAEIGDATCADAKALVGLRHITVSPDGKTVYTSARDSGAVGIFSRNTATGVLTQLAGTAGCVSSDGTGGLCAQGRGIGGARSAAVSPDNKHVYVAAQISNALAVFARDTTTGALTQLAGAAGCIAETGDGVTCADGRGLIGPVHVELSPDGKHAYLASRDSHALTVFSRNVSTGALTQLAGTAGCVAENGDGVNCADGAGLNEAVYVTVSPDGRNVYAASQVSNAIAVFSRHPTSGALTQLAGLARCVSEDGSSGACTDGKGLGGALMAYVSPEGRYVYAASYISDAVTIFSRRLANPGDFDGDVKADIGVYRPSGGFWYLLRSSTNNSTWIEQQWGLPTDVPVPGDYDGDGKMDIAVYRPDSGMWLILQSTTNYTTYLAQQWGLSTDLPVPGDYDGDGKTDIGVYRPSTGFWYLLKSSTNYSIYIERQWGLPTDVPVPADYDGDGKTDVGVYRPSTGFWYLLQSTTNYATYIERQWGLPTDVPVPGDYDGDGKADVGVYRPSTGFWYLLRSSTNFATYIEQQWGLSTDIPIPADYDGDGRTDPAVFRPSSGFWYALQSSSNYSTYLPQQWGLSTDIPVFKRP